MKTQGIGPRRCAQRVEQLLHAQGIDLTVGGEPTFVPLDPEGAEWSVDALGPTKLGYARRFLAALMAEVPKGSLLYHCSGKLYPGESLPRWSAYLMWTEDGHPYWARPERLLLDDTEGDYRDKEAKRLAEAIRDLVEVSEPVLRALGRGSRTEGYVLPLTFQEGRWISGRWPVGSGKPLRSIPGDSLLGLRLPLSSLPDDCLKMALTVEVRKGNLEVFLPPLDFKPHRDLVHKVEQATAALGLNRLVLNGYPPPSEAGFGRIGVASDPGVLEVNLPACATWAEYDQWIRRLYRAAEACGLCARKFAFNGRENGTGGGAHLCFGGPDTLRSPFFLRPDLLPSMIRYWQRYPVLSYFFTGQFLGPSSQAPRIDESTYEAMDELEIACAGVHRLGEPFPHVLYQMLFMDLLMDRSGNTHRAEISVDKLWNAQQPNGSLGIVELRAFEAFPDPDWMTSVCLFVRAILARLLKKPCTAPFIRWGAALHDRFMMPEVLWADLLEVIRDLRRHGIPYDEKWLRPLFEFRFPEVGLLETQDGTFHFRTALEPWPLLGEKSLSGATARFVDSSTERLEVCARPSGLTRKGMLWVNGQPVPLVPGGDGLAAVRFRAFYVVPGLHPHVPLQSPLVFEWVPHASGKVEVAAAYYAWKPDGGEYPHRPRDSREAQARREERWVSRPDLVGQRRAKTKPDLDRGTTLDLRRYA
ncbi:MAG: hypothetical protein OHK005_14610 [Candidatus Methylacidiphilales bacterium]